MEQLQLLNASLYNKDMNQTLAICKQNKMYRFGAFITKMLISNITSNTAQSTVEALEQYKKDFSTIRIKVLANWISTKELHNLWKKMIPPDSPIQLDEDNPDFWIIVNKPFSPKDVYVPERTIVLQMEPLMEQDQAKWGEWANPSASKFLKVYTHKEDFNSVEWHISLTYEQILLHSPDKVRTLSAIVSGKYVDPGHRKRIDFIKYLEQKQDPTVSIDVYGSNTFNYINYMNTLPYHCKDDGLLQYKYHFTAENHSIPNYFTEKIVDCILSETLCFYWGCPNINEYIDPQAYIQLDLDDQQGSYDIVRNALKEDEWSKRIHVLRAEKKRILQELSLFQRITKCLP
jgi:hypothetical protein